MRTRTRRSLGLAILLVGALSLAASALPGFSDRNIARGNLNPTDREYVMEVKITGDSAVDVTLTSATVQNLGTAGSGQIVKIEFEDGGTVLGDTTNMAGLASGITVNLGGYTVPKGQTRYIKVYVTVGTAVSGGETVELRVKFHYERAGSTYSSAWISDLTGETIRKGGFDRITDTSPDAGFLNPKDEAIVQQAVFTDDDANGNDLFWVQTGSNTIVKVENLGTATTADIEDIRVTLRVSGVDYTTGWKPWTPSSPMSFAHEEFVGLGERIPDNTSVTAKVEMRMQDAGAMTDGRTIRTKTTLLVSEGDPRQDYEHAVTARSTFTLRKQGFERIEDRSTTVNSGTKATGEDLQQVVRVTDSDINASDVLINGIRVRNLGTAAGSEIHSIEAKVGTTTLFKLDRGTGHGAIIDALKSGIEIVDGGTGWVANKGVTDDTFEEITIHYQIGTPVDGHTLRPVVQVRGQEAGVNYWSDEATYPDEIQLYQPGFEIIENLTPPEGGTAYSGQRLLAQKIRVVDRDENTDNVTIHPIVVKNTGTAQGNPDVVKIEVYRRNTEDGEALLLGETTDLSGFRTGGARVEILQDNVVVDTSPFAEAFLYIYLTIAEPEVMVAGRTIQLETRILHTENRVSYDKMSTSNQWTLAINHRPVPNFTYEKAAGTASIRPKADFTYEDTIQFRGTATDSDGDAITAWRWDFGDGNTATVQNPTHRYPNGGTFNVKLTVTDARGLTGSVTKQVVVEGPPNVPPTVDFTWTPEGPDVNQNVTFTATVTDPDQPTGTAFTYAWDFGDGTTSAAASPQHQFTEKKAYTVTLTVTDAQGGEGTKTKSISIGNEKPLANFTFAPANPTTGEEVRFTDTSTDPDAEDTIASRAWDFGDGTTSTAANPRKVFTAAGTYTVTLTVTDSRGGVSDPVTKDVTVTGPTTIVLFSFPNPAATQATITCYLPEGATNATLRIYNLMGRIVHERTLDGSGPVVWNLRSDDGANLANGVYFCAVTATGEDGRTVRSEVFRLLISR